MNTMDKSHRNKVKTDTSRYVKSTLISVLVGEIITFLILFVVAVFMSKIDMPDVMTDIFVVLASALGGLAAGYSNGLMLKEKGMIFGAISGGLLILIMVMFNLVFHDATSTVFSIIKLVVVFVLALFGGILGVNKKTKKVKFK